MVPKTIVDDSAFLSSLEEDYYEIFTDTLPTMEIDVELLEKFYLGEFNFNERDTEHLIISLHKILSGRLNEFIFYLVNTDYVFKDTNTDISLIVEQEKNKSKRYFRQYLFHEETVKYKLETLLLLAARNNYINILKFIVRVEPSIDIHCEYEYAYRLAAMEGHLQILKYLFSLEPTHGKTGYKHFNSLFITAVGTGKLDILKYLISLESLYYKIDTHYDSEVAYVSSIIIGHLDILKYLFSLEETHGKSKHSDDDLLKIAADHDQLDIVKFFIEVRRCDVHLDDDYISKKATEQGDLDTLKYILSLDSTHGKTEYKHFNNNLLEIAGENGYLDIVEFLIETHRCNVNNLNEYTIQLIVQAGNLDIFEYLINLGAKFDISIVFTGAAAYGHLNILKYLISLEPTHGIIDIHIENEYNFNQSIRFGRLELLKYLFSLEPTHGRINVHGGFDHAFWVAARNDDLDVLKFLVSLEPTHGKFSYDLEDGYSYHPKTIEYFKTLRNK